MRQRSRPSTSRSIAVGDDRRGRRGGHFVRTLVLYLTAAFGVLQALDLLAEHIGLPERMILRAAIGSALLLPVAIAAAVLREVLADDEAPGSAGPERGDAKGRDGEVPGPGPAAPGLRDPGSSPDPALAHFRLARLYDRQGDVERATHHYARFLELWEERR